METLRQMRLKPRLSVTYSYLCATCWEVEEAPVNGRCQTCGEDMFSISGLFRREQKHVKEVVAKVKKATAPEKRIQEPFRGENIVAFLTECRTTH